MQQMQLQQHMQMHLMIMHQNQMGAHHDLYRVGYVEDDRKASPFVMTISPWRAFASKKTSSSCWGVISQRGGVGYVVLVNGRESCLGVQRH
jgi:hypothetical protein